jgi:hypothetical protein
VPVLTKEFGLAPIHPPPPSGCLPWFFIFLFGGLIFLGIRMVLGFLFRMMLGFFFTGLGFFRV